MKKLFKSFMAILMFFLFIVGIQATQEELDKSEEGIEKYCTSPNAYSSISSYDSVFKVRNCNGPGTSCIEFEKSPSKIYVSADGAGNKIISRCSKVDYDSYSESLLFIQTSKWSSGTYFAFEIHRVKSDGSLERLMYDVVPSEGAKDEHLVQHVYTGHNPVGETKAKYLWKAVHYGECPRYFAMTANPGWATGAPDRYIYTDEIEDIFPDKICASIGDKNKGDYFAAMPSCVAKDDVKISKIEKCYKDAGGSFVQSYSPSGSIGNAIEDLANTIAGGNVNGGSIYNVSCPSDINSLVLPSLESCNNNYREMFSDALAKNISNTYRSGINTAIAAKVNQCLYSKCGLTNDEIRKVGVAIKNYDADPYCAIDQVNLSSSDSGQCYCCGGSQGCVYKWATSNPNPNNCGSAGNKTKEECVGNTNQDKCTSLMIEAYKHSGIDQSKIDCLVNNHYKYLNKQSQLIISNNKEFNTIEKRIIEQAAADRQTVYSYYKIKIAPKPDGPDQGVYTCNQILGSNLVKILNFLIKAMQIASAIIVIVRAMILLVPVLVSKDADALKKVSSTLVKLGILLVIIFLFKPIVRTIGGVVGFDLTCIK